MKSPYHASSRWMAVVVFTLTLGAGTIFSEETDRTRDGLVGPVRNMTTITGGSTTMRTYDRAGALLETISRLAAPVDDPQAREQVRRFVYVYDDKRQRLREMSQDQDDPPYLTRRYAYDAAGRERAEAAYHMCGTFSSLQVFSYNHDGRLHEQLIYQFRSLGNRVYEYDGQARLKAVLVYKNRQLQSTVHYRYDDQGRISEHVEVMANATPGNKTAYGYDERGRLVAEEFTNLFDPSVNAQSTYEYDDRGNWTKKTTRRVGGSKEGLSQDKSLEITERTIDYF
ncbi:MAG TPA: hypothetical protein VLC51_09065 [Nitrospira sp.]|nr:hypothetical protein [Nitrospira sp.]